MSGWNRLWSDIYGTGVNAAILVECVLPAIALRIPHKLSPRLRGGLVVEEAITVPTRVADEEDYLEELLELQQKI